MSEVYQVAFDLSALEKAFKLSEKIKTNLSGFQGFSNRTSKKDSSDFSQNIIDSNKGLKEQNKLLGVSLQKLNLMRLVSSKIKWGALAVAGLPMAGITAGIASMNGTLATNTRAKNIGLTFGESNALNFAGKMTGLGEDTLISSIEGLTTSLQDYSKWGNFASLGLNARDLQNKNPVEALFSVLDSMKDSNLPQYMKKQIVDNLGIPFDNFKFVLKEGTGEIEKYFKEGIGMFGGKNGKSLMAGERALIRFTTVLKDISQNIGGKIAPALTTSLKLVTPYIYKLADGFTWLLGKVFNKKNLDMISGAFDNRLYKELSGYATTIFKGIFEIWETISPDLFKMITWFRINILKKIKKFIHNIVDEFKYLYNKLKPIIYPIVKFFGDLAKTFLNVMADNTGNNAEVSPLKTLVDLLVSVLTPVSNAFKTMSPIVKGLADVLSTTFKIIDGITKPFIEVLGFINNKNWGGLWKWFTAENKIETSKDIKDGMNKKTAISGVAEAWRNYYNDENSLKILLDAMKNNQLSKKERKTLWGYLGNNSSKYGLKKEDFNIDDGIITPNKQVIKTNPKDYIIAMKQPQQLVTASSSKGATNYSITINNPIVRNDNDIRQLKNELERLIKSFNSKR